MPSISAYRDGIRRVLNAPSIWAGTWLVTLAIGLPLALVLRRDVVDHLGASLAAETLADGVNWEWWEEFRQRATGIGATLARRSSGSPPCCGT